MQAFVARQPILDRRQSLAAYEILSRSGPEETSFHGDPEQGTSRIIAGSLLLPDLTALTGGRPAYVNFTRELLVNESALMLTPVSTVVEIVETVSPDEEVLAACGRLRERGYRLALDDYRPGSPWDAALDRVDIVKVDLAASRPAELPRVVRALRPRGLVLLAEKVETREAFRETRELGFHLFQGYFFARPAVVAGREIPAAKLTCLQILREVRRSPIDLRAASRLIEPEVGLSYKLLRYLRSASFAWSRPVHSVEHATALLGECELRRWASVVAVAGLADDKPDELVRMSLARAYLCEALARPVGCADRAPDLFLLGLFSLVDAMLDRPMQEVIRHLPIEEDVRAALLGAPGPFGELGGLVAACLAGDWETLIPRCDRLHLDPRLLPALTTDALLRSSGVGDEEPAQAA